MSITIKSKNNIKNHKKSTQIPIKIIKTDYTKILPKPEWIKIKLPVVSNKIKKIKNIMRTHNLYSICEEASCPNITECFNYGTATFMILGTICTRHCPFCNVTHGRPNNTDPNEPERLAEIIKNMKLKYVVITSVNRDDLRDGGAKHFSKSIIAIRKQNPNIKIEILVPDFRGCVDKALKILSIIPPDIFNHNIENVPRIYHQVRPGANYKSSLYLLKKFQKMNPNIPTKSGLMVGLGETNEEILEVMHDLRNNNVTMLTLGQYLQPSQYHLSIKRYVSLKEFEELKKKAIKMGFTHAACGPLVRSSYHADLQAKGIDIK
ncbi:MAG: lipoyl synthase [Arsenophonus endosymbiont of Ceratovacuna japonica]